MSTLGEFRFNMEESWYTMSGAAALLNMKRRDIRRAYLRGELPGQRDGVTLIFHIDDLRRLKKTNKGR